MGIKMNTYAGGQMTAGNDAILHDRAIANTGILHGCNITFMGANQIHIEKGYLLIKGRYCTVTEDTIQVAMSNSETELPGRLYVRADLADAQEPVKILSVAADPLPKLTQDENINYDNGVWEMELATYTAGMTAIKDLTVTCEEVPEGASKKETAALLGKIDELTEKITIPLTPASQVTGYFAQLYKQGNHIFGNGRIAGMTSLPKVESVSSFDNWTGNLVAAATTGLRRIFSTSGNPFKLENNIYHIIGCGTRSTYNGVTGAISTNGSVVVAMFDGEYTHILLQYDAIPSASGSTQSGMFLIDILI